MPDPPTEHPRAQAPGEPPREPPRRAPGAYLARPLWQRFALSLFVAAVLVVAMVLYVNGHNTNSPTSTNPAAAVQANRDAEILIAQDQAPRSAILARGESPAAGLERSVHARMAAQVKAGSIDGELHPARCHAVGSPTGSRRAFSCSIVAGGVTYPYLGVVDTARRRITYCKRDQPPVASANIPVSARCRA
ncbi:MAG: hypothetical protein WCB67_16475 [Solirubrobacteraceae bacterium]